MFNTRTIIVLNSINYLPLVLSKKVYAIDLYADDNTNYDIQTDLEESLLILQRWCR